MDKNKASHWAGFVALGLLALGFWEALGHKNFVYGFGLSVACNLSTIALGLVFLGALFAIDPVIRYFKYEPRQVHWAMKALFVVACLAAALIVIPRPRDCPSSASSEYDYP